MEDIFVLAINPGSTSTKIAVFKNTNPVFIKTIRHSTEDLSPFDKITDQYAFRKEIILRELNDAETPFELIRAVVGRGGLVRPIPSGVYTINERMKADLCNSPMGEHASNLGGLIADDIASSLPNAQAFIADPVVVDEFDEIARLSGHPLFERVSIFHALNQKAIAREHCKSINKSYEEMNLIVVHLGGGISVGAHKQGRVIDVNQALDGDGPYSPERSGSLPVGKLVNACFSGQYTQKELMQMIKGNGGMAAYTGSNNAYDIELKAVAGDPQAKLVFEGMAYQVAKEVGAMSTVLKGDVNAILITGGIANSRYFVNMISERVFKIAPIFVYPGEDEMRALAMNGLMVIKGEVVAQDY